MAALQRSIFRAEIEGLLLEANHGSIRTRNLRRGKGGGDGRERG
jgi:hypothetical protein